VASTPSAPSEQSGQSSVPLRVLVVADQDRDRQRVLADIAESKVRVAAKWVNSEPACRNALGQGDWDVALVAWPLSGVAKPLYEEWGALPIVLIADQVGPEVLADSHALGAGVCRFDDPPAEFAKVLGRVARESGARERVCAKQAFEREQTRVLERVARGAPLAEVLEQIVGVIERHMDGACSILLLDPERGSVSHGAAPSLPEPFISKVSGMRIGPAAGSCGTAMHRAERVVVRDIASHPYWRDYKQLALPHGLVSCWSSPIFSPSRDVLGSFAVYYREQRDPREEELAMVDAATHLAAIAILRDRSQTALLASEARARQLIETTHEGVVMLDSEAHVSFANLRAAAILGYEVDDLVGKSVTKLLDRSEVARIKALVARCTRGGGEQFELHMRTRTGADLWVILAASPILDAAREMVGVLCMLTDITERKHTEEALRASEAQLRTIFQGAELGIAVVDAESRVIRSNPALERLFGRPASTLRETSLLAMTHPSDLSELSAQMRRLAAGELPSFRVDARFCREGSDVAWGRVTASLLQIESGSPHSLLMIEDIGESKRLEAAVHAEERLRALIYESVSDVIFYLSVEPNDGFRFLSVNPAFCVATGLSDRQIVGRPAEEVIAPESRSKVFANWRRAIRLRRTIRWEELADYPSGTKCGEVSVTPLFDAGGACTNLVGTVHDITERKQAEAQISEQAALLDRSRDAIVVFGLDGTVRFWNEGAVRLYGRTRAEAIGASVVDLLYRDRGQHEQAMPQLLSDGSWTGELIQHTSNGQELTVESSWTLLRDGEGNPEGVLAIHTDVSEKARLKKQVVLAQKMDSLGALAGGIAHDFNNILAAIVGHLGFAMRELPIDHSARKRLEVVEQATGRAVDLVNQILAFSRRQETNRKAINLAPIVQEALALLRASLPSMIEIQTDVHGQGYAVSADASQIHQIVLNLGTNAAHAIGEHGTLKVALRAICTGEGEQNGTDLKPGRYMCLSVQDDGTGMDEATLARIFDPFFTTKDPGRGTGLGLSVVHGIVKDHGGIPRVRSRPAEGTVFEIFFPAAGTDSEGTESGPAFETLRGKGQRILCIDDEQSVLGLMLELLDGLGYRGFGFKDVREAARAFEADPAGYDAVVTDFAMPVVTGTELAARIHALRPDLPILMTSGHLTPEQTQEAERVGVRVVLPKARFIEPLAAALFQIFGPKAG